MKVICSGMSKCGTKSLAAALRILGYKVYDIEEQFFYLGDDLLKVMNKGCTTEDIRRIFKDVDAITDTPGCMLWEEIFKAFPEAKIIHTERRTEEEWERSMTTQMKCIKEEKLAVFLTNITPTGRKLQHFFEAAVGLTGTEIKYFLSGFQLVSITQAKYREHNSHVRDIAPKDKILYFNLADGWGPFCKFLGVAEPKEKFPHKNKGGDVTREVVETSNLFKQIRKELMIELALMVSVVAILVYFLF